MEKIILSSAFLKSLARARHVIYVSFFVLCVLDCYLRDSKVPDEIVYLLAAPWVLQSAYRQVIVRRWVLFIYLAEWLLALTVLVTCQISLSIVLMLTVVFLASNAALWGWKWLLLLAGAGIGVVINLPIPAQSVAIVELVAYTWATLALLAICCIAHWQACELVADKQDARDENRDLARFLPRELPRILQEIGAGQRSSSIERRWLTVAFIDLEGFTHATRSLPSEILAELLNDFLVQVNSHVESWDGSVVKFLGDGLLCVFASQLSGATTGDHSERGQHLYASNAHGSTGHLPGHAVASTTVARSNAATQSICCAQAMGELMQRLNVQWRQLGYPGVFNVRIGISSGICAVGQWGGPHRFDFTPIGEPVNLASRLQENAYSTGLLIDETTAALASHDLSGRKSELLNLKGLGVVNAVSLPLKKMQGLM